MDRSAIKRFSDTVGRKERRRADRLLRISKKLKPGAILKTGTGKINKVVHRTDSHLFIKAVNGKRVTGIPLNNIKKMLSYFTFVRITERKELEAFHSHSSALFGLLSSVYSGHAKVSRVGLLLKLIKNGLRVYLAGGEKSPSDIAMAAKAGFKYVLYSYYWARQGHGWKRDIVKHGLRCIMDSGKFKELMDLRAGKTIKSSLNVHGYIDYIKRHLYLIDHYFVMDEFALNENNREVIADHKATMENLKIMEQYGLTPIPIFHMGTPWEELAALVSQGYPVIGIGGTVNRKGREEFLRELFNRYPRQAFHGLGITKADLLNNLPLFTCDSTAWLKCRRKGKEVILTPTGQEQRPDLPIEERVVHSLRFLKSLEFSGRWKGKVMVGQQVVLSI